MVLSNSLRVPSQFLNENDDIFIVLATILTKEVDIGYIFQRLIISAFTMLWLFF